MSTSFEDAVARLTGPGAPFEIREEDVGGSRFKVFSRTPPSLRAVFANARNFGDKTFLVYEDERLSFADVYDRAAALAAALVDRYGVGHGDVRGVMAALAEELGIPVLPL